VMNVVFFTEIGLGLTGFGVFFLFFGMILFFDKALLAIGNILFVVGLAFMIGLERTFRFFFQKHKLKATGFFLEGCSSCSSGGLLLGFFWRSTGSSSSSGEPCFPSKTVRYQYQFGPIMTPDNYVRDNV
uniref:Uncharacterized protein n=1 Tax=Neogobius melanostomus TaxID=47308 RepID=A0A8C6V104_9GOBI